MPDLKIEISDPVSRIIDAAARITEAALKAWETHRNTMSPAIRDQFDRVSIQTYWDWRSLCERAQIVGERLAWPPPPPAG